MGYFVKVLEIRALFWFVAAISAGDDPSLITLLGSVRSRYSITLAVQGHQ